MSGSRTGRKGIEAVRAQLRAAEVAAEASRRQAAAATYTYSAIERLGRSAQLKPYRLSPELARASARATAAHQPITSPTSQTHHGENR